MSPHAAEHLDLTVLYVLEAQLELELYLATIVDANRRWVYMKHLHVRAARARLTRVRGYLSDAARHHRDCLLRLPLRREA